MPTPDDRESTSPDVDGAIARVAEAQHGVFTRAQAEEIGASNGLIQRRTRTARWERVAMGVYRIAGTQRSWRQDLMIACLVWGAGAVISHRAAAALWSLAGFDALLVELIVPKARRRAGPGIVHRYPLFRGDVTTLDAIPVTTPARTLLDLTAVVRPELVEEALDDALRRGIVTIASLRRRLALTGRPGRPGTAAARALLDARDPSTPDPESVFERRLLRLLHSARLPRPATQYEIRSHGRLVARVDFAYPEARLAIEADGFRWHAGRRRWDDDRARRNRLTALGWRVVHATWTDLHRSRDLVAAITAALERR